MPFMRFALAQINPTIGDLDGNSRRIVEFAQQALAQKADVVIFPELAVMGYPPRDLLLKPQFIEDNLRAIENIAAQTVGIDVIVGFAQPNAQAVGRPLLNGAALLRGGGIVSRHYKTLLPTYDVFDESRYFEPGPGRAQDPGRRGVPLCPSVVGDSSPLHPLTQSPNHSLPLQAAQAQPELVYLQSARETLAAGLSICEDLWNDEKMIARRLYHHNPIADQHAAGAKILINTSASPFVVGKHEFRRELFASQARQFALPLIYVNQVGGNDELIFDGNSVVFDASGNVVAQAKDFAEDLLIVDLPGEPGRCETASRGVESIYKALVLGLRDYVHKCGFSNVVLGLSGGIDSALTAALAADALGADKVLGLAMPSRFSSEHSIADARMLAQNLGIRFELLPINSVHDAFEAALAQPFAGRKRDVTEENLQARLRGALLMAFSNKFNSLLLTTGNKSELATGYCTIYGDMCGGLAVLSDVPKTTVYELARWINEQAARPRIPQSSIDKVPSAELRPNQSDQDSLPDYALLDAILFRYVEQEQSAGQIIAQGFDAGVVQRVIRLVDRSEYKRRQAAPGLKVTSRAFGSGRRMPIAQNYRQWGDEGMTRR